MNAIRLAVNGRPVSEMVEARTHLADFLRDKLNLTGTHLRCEQGVCGACTVLIDGHPARACITFAALCPDAEITTIEGLEDDPVTVALRQAFSREHGLQCGFCTPGMLMTARDIVLRLPQADESQVRTELSGNLCRCTGYVGIVRAICRVLEERRGEADRAGVPQRHGVGPVGSRPGGGFTTTDAGAAVAAPSRDVRASDAEHARLGLGSRQPNLEMHKQAKIARPPAEVWSALADLERVVGCLPGARLTSEPVDGRFEGQLAVKLGPMSARFSGRGQVERDEANWRGTLIGSGQDRESRSQTAGEVEYRLTQDDGGTATRIDIDVKAILSGPLARFGRSGIVDDLASRVIDAFATNLEHMLAGSNDRQPAQAALSATALLWSVVRARLTAVMRRITRR